MLIFIRFCLFFFRVPYCLNLRCILTNFAAIQSTLPQKYAARNKSGATPLVPLHFFTPVLIRNHTPGANGIQFLFFFIFLLCFSSLFFLNFFSTCTDIRPQPLPLAPTTSSRPRGILRSDWVIRRLLLCSSDVIYLVP